MRTIERARKSVDETGRRYEAAFKSRISLFEKYNPCRVTSKLITCRECDSKINREVFGQKISLVNYVKCPVCGSKTGLYSNTANERFMVAEKKVKNTRDAYDKAKLEYGKMKADREKSGNGLFFLARKSRKQIKITYSLKTEKDGKFYETDRIFFQYG